MVLIMIDYNNILIPRLLIDLNSVLSACLLNSKDPQGKEVDGLKWASVGYAYDSFLNQLHLTLNRSSMLPRQVVAISDGKDSRRPRRAKYEAYKAHRKARPESFYKDYAELKSLAENLIKVFGGVTATCDYTEADDLIYHLVSRLDAPVVVWTRDSDMLALDATVILDNVVYPKDEVLSSKRFRFIPRKYIPLWRAIVGDTGDFGSLNAKGFGPKAFLKIIKEYGFDGLDILEDLIKNNNLSELSEDVEDSPYLQKLIDSSDDVILAYNLAQPVEVEDHKIRWSIGYPEGVDEVLFEDFLPESHLITAENFYALFAELPSVFEESPYIVLDLEAYTPAESDKWCEKSGVKVDVRGSIIAGMGLTFGSNLEISCYFSVAHKDTQNISIDDLKHVLELIPDDKPVIIHNAGGFELPVLKANIPDMVTEFHGYLSNTVDTLIAQSYVDENNSRGLKKLSHRYMRYQQASYEETTGGRKMNELSGEEVLSYGLDDTICTAALWNLQNLIMDTERTLPAFFEVEFLAQYAVAHSFYEGFKFSLNNMKEVEKEDISTYKEEERHLSELLINEGFVEGFVEFPDFQSITSSVIKNLYLMLYGEKLNTRVRKIDKLISSMPDCGFKTVLLSSSTSLINKFLSENLDLSRIVNFNVKSSLQVSKLMYEWLSLPIRFNNKLTDNQRSKGQNVGNPASNETALRWAIAKDTEEGSAEREILQLVHDCREFRTRDGLYYSKYPNFVHWKTGKIHPFLNQCSTTTRRFAPNKPNVNQLPKKSDVPVRSMIVPHTENAVLISPDFDSQELRLAALRSRDENFLSCYTGENIRSLHTVTGFSICNLTGREYKTYDEFSEAVDANDPVAKKYRADGKATNFLSQYGGMAATLSEKLLIEEDEAQVFLDARAEAFPRLIEWTEEELERIRWDKYSTTLLGARRHISKELHIGDPDKALRSAFNFGIQSSGAEITKKALGRLFLKFCGDERFRIYFPVHDEILLSIDKDYLGEVAEEVKQIMEAPYPDENSIMPFISSYSEGDNFGHMKESEWPA